MVVFGERSVESLIGSARELDASLAVPLPELRSGCGPCSVLVLDDAETCEVVT